MSIFWNVDLRHLTRDGNPAIQLALFYSYGSNPPLYPEWQEYFREHQPPTLIAWGKNDYIFPAEGAHTYKRDLENLEFHLLDTGHFALEEDCAKVAALVRDFLDRSFASTLIRKCGVPPRTPRRPDGKQPKRENSQGGWS